MKLDHLPQHASFYLIGNLLAKAIGFFLLPLYTRYLSPSEYGIIELIELVTNVSAILLGTAAFGGAMTRIYYDYKIQIDQNKVITSTLILASCISLLSLSISFTASPFIASSLLHDRSYSYLVFISLASLPMGVIIDLCLVYIRIKAQPILFVTYSLIQTLILIALNIYFIVLQNLGVAGFIYSKLLSFLIGSTFLLVIVLRSVGLRSSPKMAKDVARLSLPMVISSLCFFVIHFSDRFFLSYHQGAEAVGIYALGYKFGMLTTILLSQPFARVWDVQVFSFSQKKNWKVTFEKVFSFYFIPLLGLWLTLSVLSGDILKIVSSESFHNAAQIVPLIAFAYVLRDCGDFFRNILLINKRVNIITATTIFCATLNILLNFYLIKSFGTYGATYATLATWGVYMFTLYYHSQNEHHIPYRINKYFLASSIAVILFLSSNYVIMDMLIPSTIFHFAVVLSFFIVIWLTRYFSPSECSDALAYLHPTRRTNLEILLVSAHFPPCSAIAAHRALGFVRYLGDAGWKVNTVSIRNIKDHPNDSDLSLRIPFNAQVARTHYLDIFSLVDKFKRKKRKDCTSSLHSGQPVHMPSCPPWYKQAASSFKGQVSLLLQTPDTYIGWLPFSVLKAIFRFNRPDVILSTAPPFSSLLIGTILKNLWNTRLIVDMRDPWTGNCFRHERPGLAGRLDSYLEKYVFSKSDLIIANTKAAATYYSQIHPNTSEKIITITNGFDSTYEHIAPIRDLPPTVLSIVHFGSLYGRRDISPLLRVLQLYSDKNKESDFVFDFFGPMDSSQTYNLSSFCISDHLRIHTSVSHQEAIARMKGANVLLLYGNCTPNSLQIPAKSYEILPLQKPIWLVDEVPSPTFDLLKESESTFYFSSNSESDLLTTLSQILRLHRKGHLPSCIHLDDSRILRYSRQETLHHFQEHLIKLISCNSSSSSDAPK